jgi:hypothetical protein
MTDNHAQRENIAIAIAIAGVLTLGALLYLTDTSAHLWRAYLAYAAAGATAMAAFGARNNGDLNVDLIVIGGILGLAAFASASRDPDGAAVSTLFIGTLLGVAAAAGATFALAHERHRHVDAQIAARHHRPSNGETDDAVPEKMSSLV